MSIVGSCAFVVDLATPKPAPPKAAVPKDVAPKNNAPKATMPKATKATTKPNITVGPKATSTSVRHHPRGDWFDSDDDSGVASVASVSCGALVVVAVVVIVIIMMIRKS